ncbi:MULTISPECIES: hypothetical protein [Nostoc cyanobionts]|uniref:hypothetical protein n=1 Tax=Nostoc cyanobionts TaxID=3123326 RepID=UPI0015E27623|nr:MULTISPECIES: hypothetical protein [unclassified Nostoc]
MSPTAIAIGKSGYAIACVANQSWILVHHLPPNKNLISPKPGRSLFGWLQQGVL